MTEILPALDSTSVLIALSPEQLVWSIAEAADDRKGADLTLLKVTEVSYLADYFVMVTGYSRTQVRAIADSIEQKIQQQYQRLPLHTEGRTEGNWILQDFGDVLVHIFMPDERDFYQLEAFWGHAQRVSLPELAQTLGTDSKILCPKQS